MSNDELEIIVYFRKVRNDLTAKICTSGFYEKYKLGEITEQLERKEKELLSGFIQDTILK